MKKSLFEMKGRIALMDGLRRVKTCGAGENCLQVGKKSKVGGKVLIKEGSWIPYIATFQVLPDKRANAKRT